MVGGGDGAAGSGVLPPAGSLEGQTEARVADGVVGAEGEVQLAA